MKFCIATLLDHSYAHIATVTNPNKSEYAKCHGYEYLHNTGKFPCSDRAFARVRWFLSLVESGKWDWVLCCGGDVIFTNYNIKLESLVSDDDHFLIAKDALMFQCDVFMVRNSAKGLAFMRRWLSTEPQYREAPLKEQEAIQALYPEFKDTIRIVPQRVLQGYEYALYTNLGGNYALAKDADGNDGQWQPGDFALHVPAHMERKAQILREHLPMVCRPIDEKRLLSRMNGVSSLLCPGQEWWLYQKALGLPESAVIFELGCYHGRSTIALALACIGTRRVVYSVDNNQSYIDVARANMAVIGLGPYVRFINGESDSFPALNPALAFIDGDHHRPALEKDFREVSSRAKPGCVIAFHDVIETWPEVLKFWNEVASTTLINHQRCHSIAAGTTT